MKIEEMATIEEKKLYLALTSKDGIAERYYESACERYPEEQEEIRCGEYVYDNNEEDKRKVCAFAGLVERALEKIKDKEIKITLSDLCENHESAKAAYDQIEEIAGKAVANTSLTMRNIILYLQIVKDAYTHMQIIQENDDINTEIEMYLDGTIRQPSSYEKYTKKERFIIAEKTNWRDVRITRLFKLKEMNAYDFMIQKERGLIVESLYFFLCSPIKVDGTE